MAKNDFPIDQRGNPVDITNLPEKEEVAETERNRQQYLAAERERWRKNPRPSKRNQ